MAAQLKKSLGVDTDLVRGATGEFTVWVGETKVIEKLGQAFPTEAECEHAVAKAMQGGA